MKSPFTGGETYREVFHAEHRFRKEGFHISEHRHKCMDTDQVFYSEETDRLNIVQIHNQYRSRYQIPFPSEIQATREKYGLSSGKMSEVLGFGINSYRQYEQGEMPSQANAKLIRLAANPQRFEEFLEEKPWLFSEKQLTAIRKRIRELTADNQLGPIMSYLWNYHLQPTEYTGFVNPDLQKIGAFVSFFADRCRPLKTRLNKLLFYADFLHFKRYGLAISGCSYRAIPYGPVPSHFRELFGLLESQKIIEIEEEEFPSGHIGERFTSGNPVNLSGFTQEELDCMNQVVSHFDKVRTRKLIDISHEEIAWKDNFRNRDLISFQKYGFTLSAL